MADSPLAIRVSEEVKALFNELAEQSNFENKGDFFNRLLVLYQAESVKQDVSLLEPAIETVGTLSTRLLEVLNGTAAAITTKEEQHRLALEEQRKSFEETRTLLQQRIKTLELERAEDEERTQSFISDKKTAEGKTDELLERIEQLESTVNDKAALVEEYKAKNDTLNGIISEQKAVAAEGKSLSETVNNQKQVNESLQRQVDELTRELQQKTGTHTAELESLRKSMFLEKETALLELKLINQGKLEEQQAKHTTAINDYEIKVRDLLSRMEQGESVKQVESEAKAPAPPSKPKSTARKPAAKDKPPTAE